MTNTARKQHVISTAWQFSLSRGWLNRFRTNPGNCHGDFLCSFLLIHGNLPEATALMHVYVRRENFPTKSRFQNMKL